MRKQKAGASGVKGVQGDLFFNLSKKLLQVEILGTKSVRDKWDRVYHKSYVKQAIHHGEEKNM